ncbi:hypothetical protein U0070_014813 [Myodes glareolus]|uniref:Uncharacterized protein n=1 Tax=Myodes glareolus TaxID=447135 RepID=A0AAW0JG54_MYOGA
MEKDLAPGTSQADCPALITADRAVDVKPASLRTAYEQAHVVCTLGTKQLVADVNKIEPTKSSYSQKRQEEIKEVSTYV